MLGKIKAFGRSIINGFDERYRSKIRILDGESGYAKRYSYYAKRLKYLGKNVVIETGVFLKGCEFISIADNTLIDKNCILVASPPNIDISSRYIKERKSASASTNKGEIVIGRDCHISQNCMIYGYWGVRLGDRCVMSADAKIYSLTSMCNNPYNESEIVSIVPYSGKSPSLVGSVYLDDNVWLGINVIVSPGVHIGKNSFVRSNSIVNASFGENSYIAGDPATAIRSRYKL